MTPCAAACRDVKALPGVPVNDAPFGVARIAVQSSYACVVVVVDPESAVDCVLLPLPMVFLSSGEAVITFAYSPCTMQMSVEAESVIEGAASAAPQFAL